MSVGKEKGSGWQPPSAAYHPPNLFPQRSRKRVDVAFAVTSSRPTCNLADHTKRASEILLRSSDYLTPTISSCLAAIGAVKGK
jgi:hypothetical protein